MQMQGQVYGMLIAVQVQCAALSTVNSLTIPSTRPRSTQPQPGAAEKRDYEGTRAAASSCLSGVGRVGGVVGMLGV